MSANIIDFFVSRLEVQKNQEKAEQMEAYMKGKQPFLGVQTPQRKIIYKEFKQTMGKSLKTELKEDHLINTIHVLWDKREREYRFVALFILDYFKITKFENLDLLRNLIISGDWWDTTDSIAPNHIGELLKSHKTEMTEILKLWVHDENMWIRRSAILSQLKFKAITDTEFLEYCITNTMHEKEFFIQKAIGWILREYSKTNRVFVSKFIEKNKKSLSKLSIREGSKYL